MLTAGLACVGMAKQSFAGRIPRAQTWPVATKCVCEIAPSEACCKFRLKGSERKPQLA